MRTAIPPEQTMPSMVVKGYIPYGTAENFLITPQSTVLTTQNTWYRVLGTTVLRSDAEGKFDTFSAPNMLRYIGTDEPSIKTHVTAAFSARNSVAGHTLEFSIGKIADMDRANLVTVAPASAQVDIIWRNHKADSNDTILIEGVVSAISGIPSAELNGLHAITSIPDANTIRITVTTTATQGGVAGGQYCDVTALMASSRVRCVFENTADIVPGHMSTTMDLEVWERFGFYVRNTSASGSSCVIETSTITCATSLPVLYTPYGVHRRA